MRWRVISSLEYIEPVLKAEAGKVSMNSAEVKDPNRLKEAPRQFGKEKITIAIDPRKNQTMPSGFELVMVGGTKPVRKEAVVLARQCQVLGAGVILPTSMYGNGTQAGYDLEFTRVISDAVDLPMVASGGAGKLENFYGAVVKGGGQILLPESVFHYRIFSIKQVKEYLKQKGLNVIY